VKLKKKFHDITNTGKYRGSFPCRSLVDMDKVHIFHYKLLLLFKILYRISFLQTETRDNTTTQVDNANVIKDRLLIFAICLISTIPCPLLFSSYKLFTSIDFNLTDDQSILFSIIWAIFNSNYPLVQCIEEICLFIMSKDFRKLVKNHFVRNTQTHAVATTVYVSQQQGMRQFHVHRNNLVNNN